MFYLDVIMIKFSQIYIEWNEMMRKKNKNTPSYTCCHDADRKKCLQGVLMWIDKNLLKKMKWDLIIRSICKTLKMNWKY